MHDQPFLLCRARPRAGGCLGAVTFCTDSPPPTVQRRSERKGWTDRRPPALDLCSGNPPLVGVSGPLHDGLNPSPSRVHGPKALGRFRTWVGGSWPMHHRPTEERGTIRIRSAMQTQRNASPRGHTCYHQGPTHPMAWYLTGGDAVVGCRG
uniref:Uncharacterized protein n=1 Tax=Eutreptiella gymnastica TaxID=73025 RepID=A0A7S4CC54_9EUGL